MKTDTIFIHIPKTGGTTINAAMQGTYWANEPGFNYRHILLKEKRSNSADIFIPSNRSKYKEHTLFMMVRDPVDRLISEYYFLKERKNFMDLLRIQPKCFEDYIKNPQTQNYMVGFLVGRRIFDTNPTKESDLDNVLDAIEELPIHTGIFECFNESLSYFSSISEIKWNKKIEVKRMTLNRPRKDDVSQEIKNLIVEKNQLDQELYDFCFEIFQEKTHGLSKTNITFIKDKYNHILPYTAGTCLFEFCMENKSFLVFNRLFFKELTFFLHKDLGITDGKQFVRVWNKSFVNTIAELESLDSSLKNSLADSLKTELDPLENTILIGELLDRYLIAKNNSNILKQQPIKFNKELIEEPTTSKGGFWRGLLKR